MKQKVCYCIALVSVLLSIPRIVYGVQYYSVTLSIPLGTFAGPKTEIEETVKNSVEVTHKTTETIEQQRSTSASSAEDFTKETIK